MKTVILATACVLAFGTGAMLAPAPAMAAHAGAPYTNVDHSNDDGNATGDSRVDALNSGQLNKNYQGPLQLRAPADGTATGMAQPPGAPPPPPPATTTTTVTTIQR
jgi:hypothetical protein